MLISVLPSMARNRSTMLGLAQVLRSSLRHGEDAGCCFRALGIVSREHATWGQVVVKPSVSVPPLESREQLPSSR